MIYPNLPQFTILQYGWFFPGSDNKNIRWCIAIFLTLHILIFGYINTIFLYYIVESVARSVWSQTGRFVVVFLYRGNVRFWFMWYMNKEVIWRYLYFTQWFIWYSIAKSWHWLLMTLTLSGSSTDYLLHFTSLTNKHTMDIDCITLFTKVFI